MISHKHKVIFVHIPKCAGQSIERLFLDDRNLGWDERAELLLRPNHSADLGPPRLAHLTAEDYVKYNYITEEKFFDYFKFAIFRDPIDRAISTFNYLNPNCSFDNFLCIVENTLSATNSQFYDHKSYYYFLRPQSDFLFHEDGRLIVKHIFPFDEVLSVQNFLIEKFKLNATPVYQNKTTEKRIHRNSISNENIRAIKKIYESDFDFLATFFA